MSDKIAEIVKAAAKLLEKKKHIIIAIDGRSAAGKTTLSEQLREQCGCGVVRMDDFFLRPEQRTPERFKTPGANVDHERFLKEVMPFLYGGEDFSYRPYDCRTQSLSAPIFVKIKPINIVEGAYSCHPALWDYYDLHVFLSVEKTEQLNRLMRRNGAAAEQFRRKWIPLEEEYFSAYNIEQRCELRFLG